MDWTSDDGRIRLYLGDCLDLVLEHCNVDLVVTSPPYNCGKDYGENTDSLPWNEYWAWTEEWVHRCCTTLAPHGYLCVNHANYIGQRDERVGINDELRPILDRHLPNVDTIIWDKGPANGAGWGNFRSSPRIRAQHENIHVNGGCHKMPDSDIDWADWSRFTTSIWRIAPADQKIHPAMMPVEIPRRLALLYSPAGGQVLDPFMGSGTTGVGCVLTGRAFIGIERDPRHFQTAVNRIKEAMGYEIKNADGTVQRRMFTPETHDVGGGSQ